MRRNLNKSRNGRRVLDKPRTGELGSSIPVSGTDGASFLLSAVNLYGLQTSEVSARVTSTNLPTGTWQSSRNGVFETSGSIPDGRYYVNYDFSIFGRKQPGSGVLNLTFGNAAPVVSSISSSAVTAGQTATIAVVGSGVPTPTYQWHRQPAAGGGYVAISGAVSASYTTPATTVTDGAANHGDYYRCILTNAAGSVTSVSARLVVLASVTAPVMSVSGDSGLALQLGFGASPVHALTLSAADTATVDVPFAISIVNTGNSSENWSITPPANVTLSVSSGTIAAGATVNLTGTASVANTYTITLVCAGATITGNGQSVVASVPSGGVTISMTGPSGGMARTVSGLWTVTHSGTLAGPVVVTLSDGDSNSRFYPLSNGDAVGTVGISPSVPVGYFFYAPASAGSKSVTATNNGGHTNPSAVSYTATAAVGSATPFRLTRGGSTIGSYARLQQCREAGWQSGDVVKVAAGTYAMSDDRYDVGSLSVKDNWPGGIETGVNIDTLTIEAEDINNPPFIDFSWWCAVGIRSGGQPQGITAGIPCHNITLRGIHMRGSPAPSGSTIISAAFWTLTDYLATEQPAAFLFDRCLFTGWGDGIKTRTHAGISVQVNSCVFIDNSDAAAGLHHDIYTGNNALTEVVGSTFIRTGTVGYKQSSYGHFVKSRCRTTTVRANRFYAYMDADGFGGANSLINTPCGGVVEITGNVLIDYGAMGNGSAHNILRSGEQQFPTSGEPSVDPLLLTHSYLIAQNTTLQLRGYPLGDGNSVPVFKLYHNNTGNPSGALVATGVPTQALTGTGVLVDVTTTIRNNIVANYDSTQSSTFLSQYPNNTLASLGTISELGYYTGGTVSGSPAVNDADFEWAGDYLAPIARTDTNRGARTVAIPTWVPATAWQWTQIPGTRWSDVMKPVSAGGVAPSQVGDPVGSSYDAQWAFGAITYSKKNHEMWLFGGGHDDTTINALSKWTLGTNSPFVSMACEPTAVADRVADWAEGDVEWTANMYHTETNPKPKSAHSYSNNRYFDDIDEFVLFGLAGVDKPGSGNWGYYGVAGFHRGGSQWRAEGHWPSTDLTVGTYGLQNQVVFESHDGTALYYARKYTALFKYTSAGVKTTIGTGLGAGIAAYAMRGAAESASRALLGGGYDHAGGTGWRLWFVDLTTGVATAVTVSGAAWPTDFAGYQYNSMVWVPSLGRYFALITSLTGTYVGSNINAVRIFEFEPTGPSTVTATEKAITGTRPIRFDLMGPMHYDPAFGVLLLGSSPAETLFTIKVA